MIFQCQRNYVDYEQSFIFLRDSRVSETRERVRKLPPARSRLFRSFCCSPYKKGGTNRSLQLLMAAKCYRGSSISQRDSKGPFHICERCLLHRTQMSFQFSEYLFGFHVFIRAQTRFLRLYLDL